MRRSRRSRPDSLPRKTSRRSRRSWPSSGTRETTPSPAIRKRLLDGGHHHNAAGEAQGIFDEGFVIVTKEAKKSFLDSAVAIGKSMAAPTADGLSAEWAKVKATWEQAREGLEVVTEGPARSRARDAARGRLRRRRRRAARSSGRTRRRRARASDSSNVAQDAGLRA